MSDHQYLQFFDSPGFLCVRHPIYRYQYGSGIGKQQPTHRVVGYNNILVFDTEEYFVHADLPRTGAFKLIFYPKTTYIYRKMSHRNVVTVYANSRGISSVRHARSSDKHLRNFSPIEILGSNVITVSTIKDYNLNIDKKMLIKFLTKLDETSKPSLSNEFVNTVRKTMEQIISIPA